jgi:hypothetical protein
VKKLAKQTRIKVYHNFDEEEYLNNKINITFRNINTVIKLIFKNTKDQSAIFAVSSSSYVKNSQEIIDEKRLSEIQKIASTMKVAIPKRFETKSSVREFIQSREFISAIKISMNV